jgi:Cof subfamily protein (haloacid dehalogenase superfamily)
VEIVLVTARPPRGIVEIARNALLSGVAICQNGAVTVDVSSGAIVERFPLPPEIAGPLIARLRARLPTSAFAAEAGPTFRHESHYTSQYPFPIDAEIAVADALADERLTKLLIRDPERGFEDLEAIVRDEVGDSATVTTSDTTFVDITALGVTKLSALERIVGSRRLTAENVMAFGDMPIDLPMLLWAGRGVAMANAHPEVLAAVREHTLSNDEDGVALALVAAGVI